jgi:hypothetical protein
MILDRSPACLMASIHVFATSTEAFEIVPPFAGILVFAHEETSLSSDEEAAPPTNA